MVRRLHSLEKGNKQYRLTVFPMRAEFRKFYGRKWRKIRRRILERAGWECERCGLPDRPMGLISTLEVAHLSGEPSADPDEDGLACLCHRCHRRHDYQQWFEQFQVWLRRERERRAEAKDRERPILVLLEAS